MAWKMPHFAGKFSSTVMGGLDPPSAMRTRYRVSGRAGLLINQFVTLRVKTKILQLLRRLAGKGAQSKAQSPASEPALPAVPPRRNVISAYVGAPRNGSATPSLNGNGSLSKTVDLSLQKILAGLSLELQPRVIQREVGARPVFIPLEKILAQLSRGQVRITFGELRNLAPDVFTPESDRDAAPVGLPLDEILSKLNPALITRRRVQRQVEVPEEITSPFDPEARDLLASQPALSNGGTTGNPVPPVAPSLPFNRSSLQSAPTQKAPEALPNSLPGIPLPRNRQGFGTNGSTAAHKTPEAIAPSHKETPPATPLPASIPPLKLQTPTPPPPAPVIQPEPHSLETARPAPEDTRNAMPPLVASLANLATNWPEAVRNEILNSDLAETQVNLPFEALEQGLKQGRVLFPWKTLRMWLRPAPQLRASPQDSTVLELPLHVVAPLFLSRKREINGQRAKVSVDKDIPNLFFGFPQPEPEAKPATQDTNFYVWDDSRDQVKAESKETSPGTRFVSKYATPNEVVSRAAALENVAGALIALPDGLMVANRLPSDLNGDTLSAFLPQIFAKVSQCTRELRMGELNNLNFTVGNVPWKIFRINAIYFAAFGKVGAPLPTAQLAALASELDHKPK